METEAVCVCDCDESKASIRDLATETSGLSAKAFSVANRICGDTGTCHAENEKPLFKSNLSEIEYHLNETVSNLNRLIELLEKAESWVS
jgi:hypothetical protein